ncbi:MAG: PLP-dependent aspartate aminotransferase family protein [Bacteroidales bacterium]|nr:PLP-dependent aspartate aminotransferase family protein [Bacteroidales bacterium]
MKIKNPGFNTKMVHAGTELDELGSVNVPIYQTSTFAFRNAKEGADRFAGKDDGYIYTRIANPTIHALEKNITALENGFGAIATSSGMGAVTSIYMALLNQGAHMISTASVYGPSRVIMEKHFSRFGVESTYVDTSNTDNIVSAIKPNTKVLYIETPSNPTMQLTDLEACSKIAKENDLILVVDNTFSSPYLQNPLDLGADIVFHSVTKFINGHADIVGGIIVTRTEEMYKKVRPMMVNLGFNMDPHQAFMVLRGVKTLSIRIEKAQESAGIIADWLEKHPKVEWVKYPGLKSHPQRELAKRQMKGFGSMISFGLKGGLAAGEKLMNNMNLALLAVSLGGVESLIQHPASMTHSSLPREERIDAGIDDGLVRYSVGIENVEDLIEDLNQALMKV